MSASVVPAVRRQRAPTMTIDTSAVEAPTGVSSDNHAGSEAVETTTYELPHQSSATLGEQRPVSPHSITSSSRPSHGYLSVTANWLSILNRSDQPRFTPMENGGSEMTSGVVTVGTGSPELAPDNPFAFTPGYLNKVFNPKSLPAFWKFGGLAGIEKGLRTDRHSGLSVDETCLSKSASFDGPSSRLYRDRAYQAPTPHSEPGQYCYSKRGNTSANAESPDEDWTKITDLAERRRIQNRIAQRNYRKKLKRRLEDLEQRAAKADSYLSAGDAEHGVNPFRKQDETTRADWAGGAGSLGGLFPQAHAACSKKIENLSWRMWCSSNSGSSSSRETAEIPAFSGAEHDEILWAKDRSKVEDEYPSRWGIGPWCVVTEMWTEKEMECLDAHLARHHHRQPQPIWYRVGAPDITGGIEGQPNVLRPHNDKPSLLGLPFSWLLSVGTALGRILPASRPRRQRPLPPSHTLVTHLLLFLLAAPPASAQHHIPPALLHIAAGTSFATSATIPPLRGSSTVPAPWWIAMYAAWGAAFTLFLVAELLRRPSWAQRRLLVGLLLFSGLNLTGSLVQGGDSMLEGVASWGPLAMTASLWLVPVLMEFWGVRGAGELVGL